MSKKIKYIGTTEELISNGYKRRYNGEEYVYTYSFPVVKSKSLTGEITINDKNFVKLDVYDTAFKTQYNPFYYDFGNCHKVLISKIYSVFNRHLKKIKVKKK